MASKADTWMPFYIADYLRKTMHLTRDQHGGYFLLLMACWDRGGRLPNDPNQLAGIVRATAAEWRKLAPVLLPYFDVEGDYLVQGRVLEERQKATRLSEARRESGRQGGRPRKPQSDTKLQSERKPIGLQNGSQNETPAGVRSSPSPENTSFGGFPPDPQGGPTGLVLVPEEPDPVRQAFELWNGTARRCGLPVAEDLTDKRRKAIGARLEKGGLPRWRKGLDTVERSRLCRGMKPGKDGGAPWRVTLDWMIGPGNFQKLVEGAYPADIAPPADPSTATPPDPLEPWRKRVSEFKRNRYWNETDWGGRPGALDCQVPSAVLEAHGYQPPQRPAA